MAQSSRIAFFARSIAALLLFLSLATKAQPPACTSTVAAGAGVIVVNAGQVYCVPNGGSFTGSFLVNAGGAVVICQGTFTGSLTIQPGGHWWTAPSVTYTGAVANFGTLHSAAGNCASCTVGAASSTPTLCVNTAMTAITHATTGVTGITSSTGLPAGVTASYAANTVTISGTPTVAGTFNYTIDVAGCADDATGTITVTADNTAGAASSSPTLCINTALVNITHATTGATGISNDGVAGANGLPGGVSATWAGNTITISGTPSAAGTFNYSIPLTGGCGTVNATGTIVVNALPTPTLVLGTDAACIDGGALNLSGGLPLGGIYSGNGVGVSPGFNPATAGVGTHTITYTYTDGNGCVAAVTDDFTVNALPTPSLTLVTDVACVDAVVLNLSGGTPIGGVYSGSGVGLSPSFNPGNAGVGTHTITYTYTDGNGCVGAATDDFTVNALPTPTLVLGTDAACVDAVALNLTGGLPVGGVYSGNGVGVSPSFDPGNAGVGTQTITYTYTDGNGCVGRATDDFTVNALPTPTLVLGTDAACVDAVALNLTGGLPVGGVYSGNGVGVSPSFNPGTAGTGTHTITYTYTDGNGCIGSVTDDFTVNALPAVNVPLDFPVCVDAAPIILSQGTPVGGTYSGPGITISPQFDPTQAGAGIHTITYTYTDVNGCTASASDVITVNDLPAVSFALPNDQICENNVALTLSGGSPFGGTYSGTGVTAGAFDPSGLSGSYTITYTFTDGNGCVNSATDNISVNDVPTLGTPVDGSRCGPGAVICEVTNVPIGATVDWFSTGTDTTPFQGGIGKTQWTTPVLQNSEVFFAEIRNSSTGCRSNARVAVNAIVNNEPVVNLGVDIEFCDGDSATLDAGNPGLSFLWNTGSTGRTEKVKVSGVYDVLVTDGNLCEGRDTVIVTVNPLPNVSLLLDLSLCVDGALFPLTAGSPVGGVYSGPGVSGDSFNPGVAGPGKHPITYTYTDGKGCSDSATDTITVNDLPVVTLSVNPDELCIDAVATSLSGGMPLGGVYSGTAVQNGNFTASAAGAGKHEITYTYTDANACVNTATDTLLVNNLPVVGLILGIDSTCQGSNTQLLSGGSPIGGVYNGVGVNGNSIDPIIAGTGIHTVTYTFTDNKGCVNSAVDTFEVNPLPTVNFSLRTDSICEDGPLMFLLGGAPISGQYSGNGVTNGVFSAAAAGAGKHEITYTYTDAKGCVNTASDSMRVDTLPLVSLVLNPDNVCEDLTALTLIGGNPQGGIYTGTGVDLGVFSPAIAGVGSTTITYTYTDSHGCRSAATDDLTVNALPTMSWPNPTGVCLNSGALTLSGATPQGGQYLGTGVSNSVFDPQTAGVGVHNLTYEYTDGNGCYNSISVGQEVYGLPNARLGADVEVCKYLNVDVTVPQSNLQYAWGKVGKTGVIGTGQTLSTNEEGIYYVDVYDGNNCWSTDTIQYRRGANLVFDAGPVVHICQDVPQEFTVSGPYDRVHWNGDTSSHSTKATLYGNDTLEVLVIDSKGCFAKDTLYSILIPQLTVDSLQADTTICERAGDEVVLTLANTGVSYNWQDGSTSSDFMVYEAGTYWVEIENSYGCKGSDTVEITSYCTPIDLTMPNAMTPNGDGYNDYLRPLEMEWADKDFMMSNILEIRFMVYDRWGILVHATEGELPRWNGNAPNGKPCSDGTYFWIVEYTDATGTFYELNGFVKLHRTD